MHRPRQCLLIRAASAFVASCFLRRSSSSRTSWKRGPGFAIWFNAHVARGITPGLFWSVNYWALAITAVVVVLEWVSESRLSTGIAVAWLSFLMLANALLHIVATLVDRAYVPGVFTAVLLYLPFYAWLLVRVARTRRLSTGVVVVTAVTGAAPMLLHGYLIVFRGSRLF